MSEGHDAHFVECDVSCEDAVNKMVQHASTISNRPGTLDAVVNVAGVDIIAKLEDTDAARWDRVMNVNLRSVFLVCKVASQSPSCLAPGPFGAAQPRPCNVVVVRRETERDGKRRKERERRRGPFPPAWAWLWQTDGEPRIV